MCWGVRGGENRCGGGMERGGGVRTVWKGEEKWGNGKRCEEVCWGVGEVRRWDWGW